MQRTFPANLGNYLAETAFTLTSLTTAGGGSIPFRTSASRDGWGCGIALQSGTGDLFLTQVTGGMGEAMPTTVSITAPTVGTRYRLLGGGYGTSLYCMLSTGQKVTRTAPASEGNAGVRASGADARFEYLLVYRLGGTIP
jgi:hypothetical protein